MTDVATTKKKKNKSMIQRRLIPSYIFLTIFAVFSVFPFYWMISAATNTMADVSRGRLLPGTYAIQNFKNLIASQPLGRAMANSFAYAVSVTLLCLFICSLAGFGFEMYNDRYKDVLFTILLLAMMIPQVATMIPLFQMFSKANLLNTIPGFFLPMISTPFMIMMFRQNSRNFPREIMEAARMDGLREIGIFFRMYFPIMRSTYAAAAVITFMNSWNAYLWPKVCMTNSNSLNMVMLVSNMTGGYVLDYGMIMMGVLFCSIPTMVIFFVLQRQFTEGITGSVK